MPDHGLGFSLGPDELAFYFSTTAGVDAGQLGQFLQRAASVARREKIELSVVAVRNGSLAIVFRALKRAGSASRKEFEKAPIATTSALVAAVAIVVPAIISAMSPAIGEVTPIAKAGASLIENHNVVTIEVVTSDKRILVMNHEIAREIHSLERRTVRSEALERFEFRASQLPMHIIEMAREGTLSGYLADIDGQLHFRPDGYRFFVPIDENSSSDIAGLHAGKNVRIVGEIITQRGRPEGIVITSVTPE